MVPVGAGAHGHAPAVARLPGLPHLPGGGGGVAGRGGGAAEAAEAAAAVVRPRGGCNTESRRGSHTRRVSTTHKAYREKYEM